MMTDLPHIASDQRRYVKTVVLEPPVVFRSQEHPQLGISLQDYISALSVLRWGHNCPFHILTCVHRLRCSADLVICGCE